MTSYEPTSHFTFVLFFLILHVNFCNFCNLLYKRCIEYGCSFTNNGAVSKIDLWTDGIHLLDSGKTKIANNLISSFNYFLGTVISNRRSH